jgi:uncharacterized protein YndB with AHSA1/START domain
VSEAPTPGVPPERGRIEIRRRLPARPDEVFAAWTDPATMSVWMSPVGFARVEAELRVGGKFRIVMVGEGTEIEHTGEYIAIEVGRRLVFTWRSPYTGDLPTLVTVTFTPAGEATDLTLVHEGLPGEVSEPHAGGWRRMVDRLVRTLRPRAGEMVIHEQERRAKSPSM